MKLTRYDRISSGMIATFLFLILSTGVAASYWYASRPPREPELIPMELLDLSGGDPEGATDEAFEVESPEELVDDASLAEELSEEVELQETLDNVVELSDQAAMQLQQVNASGEQNVGTPGSSVGSGRRPLGSGPGSGGLPREQRWYIRYADQADLDEYARQLDHFGIELGALLPAGELVYLSNISTPNPQVRRVTSGSDEKRLYMTWRGGDRRQADTKLFAKAGLDVGRSEIFHFYPPRVEQRLATLEHNYARRAAKEIRRTYFVVEARAGGAYELVVTRQTYFR
ncbi:MAG: hypothetical protein ACF8TS_07800 [Maioricimonas sp. JB049]